MSVYPFVASAAKYGTRKGPVKAFVVHMAEGGSTVGFLSRPNARGVSVHYVIETSGRIVQMTKETMATGSINPNDLRTTDDAETYGATARRRVMGGWDHDPNSAVISCEIEGFAKTGPNAAEHGSLKALIADVRSRYPDMGLLGHRDFQDYKACPGKLIHWADLGGHGPAIANEEEPVRIHWGIENWRLDKGPNRVTTIGSPIRADGKVDGSVRVAYVPIQPPGEDYAHEVDRARLDDPRTDLDASLSGLLAGYQLPASSDCADAVAAEHERTKQAAVAAVEAIA